MLGAINEAFNVTLKQKGVPVLFSKYANTTGLDFTNETLYAKGKGTNKIRFDKNRQLTFKMDFEIWDMEYVSLILGGTQEKKAGQMHKVEMLEVGDANKVTLSMTPVSNSVVAFTTEADGITHKEKLTAEVSGSQVTFSSPSTPEGTPVIVYYLTATGESTVTTTIKSNVFAGEFEIIGDTFGKDLVGGEIPVQFNILKAVPKGDISLTFGDAVSTLSVTFDAFPDKNENMIIVDEIVIP